MSGIEWCEENLTLEFENEISTKLEKGDDLLLKKIIIKAYEAGKKEEILTE